MFLCGYVYTKLDFINKNRDNRQEVNKREMNIIDGNISFAEIANFSIALALVVSTFLSIIFIAKGGFSFITSGGDDEKIKAAVHTVRYAIVGLVVIFLSVLIIKIVGAIFGFNFLSYLSLEKIQEMASIIIDRLKETPDGTSLQGVLD